MEQRTKTNSPADGTSHLPKRDATASGDLRDALVALHKDERGATSTEYAVLLVLTVCTIIFIVSIFGERVNRLYQMAVDTLYRDVRI